MIYATPGSSFEAVVNGYATGLATVRVRILDNAGATVYGPSTAGVAELVAGSGSSYVVTLTAPAVAGQYSVGWDTGTVSPATWTTEDLTVTATAPGPAVPSGIDLCTLAQVREYLQKPGADTAQDAAVSALITRASRAIATWTEREFPNTGAATRRFRVDGHLVNLAPYDLRSVTAVTLNPEATSPSVLGAATGYSLGAYNSLGGTYQALRIGNTGALWSAHRSAFGYGLIEIAGVWGMASIPEDVQYACIVTVSIWMRRDVQAFSTTFNLDSASLERPEALPAAVRAMLSPYRRVVV